VRGASRAGGGRCPGAHAIEKKIAATVRQEVTAELDRVIARVLQEGARRGRLDLEATELALRRTLHQVGGRLLEQLLNADGGGYRGRHVPCGQGHQAGFVASRAKTICTVLAPVAVQRAYYHCGPCGRGVIPKDHDLDIAGTTFSPGVRRLMGRVGGKEAFAEGRRDLAELAGIVVTTKAVERVAEALGAEIETLAQAEQAAALAGKLVPLQAVPTLYVAIDGTGVPVVPHETEGRPGKDATGRAKTREAKLGCVFTQTGRDAKGRPVRDEGSTSYVGAIEPAEAFGRRLYAEAVRRGVPRAARVVVLGDGAPWIWGLAAEHFPGAIQIVDLYHAREHLAALGQLLYGPGSPAAIRWTAARAANLDAGAIEQVAAALGRLRPRGEEAQEAVRKAQGYFETNAERMRYARFRRQGLFVGSGVVEAGCKTIIGFRLKQSGMRWTVRGANAIIALRCAHLSGRWEEFWEARAAG
jgi:hypothetical protein